MKKLLLLIPVLLIFGIIYNGCQEQPVNVPNNSGSLALINIDNSGQGCTPIYAGQNIEVGSICLEDDFNTNTLTITYLISVPGWEITDIHFVVAEHTSDIPQTKKGNLIPGQFPYTQSFASGVTTYTITVPFDDFGAIGCDNLKDFFAAAHCVVQLVDNGIVVQTESGWGNGSITPGNSWGEIFSFRMECDPNEEEQNTETAFAYGCNNATCFLDIPNEDFNRWGWTNGPLTDYGTYYFDIYAGAGQCNLTSGTRVGELIVEYDGSTADVTFTTCGNYTMDETHLYVGCDILPMNNGEYTIAPGQFGNLHEDLDEGTQTDSYTISGLDCPDGIYVVAHAVVKGNYTSGDCGTEGCEFVPPPCDEWVVYGSNLGSNDKIYSVDLKSNPITVDEIFDPGILDSDTKWPNGNAYDPDNHRIYLSDHSGTIYYYDLDDNALTTVGSGYGTIASGAWYDGYYYFVPDNSNKLYKLVGTTKTFVHDVPAGAYYGDIIINSDGLLIGSAFGNVWYTYDITSNTITNLVKSGDGGTTGAWQLAYASNGELIAHDATTGDWFRVTITGNDAHLSLIGNTAIKLTDLASGPACQ